MCTVCATFGVQYASILHGEGASGSGEGGSGTSSGKPSFTPSQVAEQILVQINPYIPGSDTYLGGARWIEGYGTPISFTYGYRAFAPTGGLTPDGFPDTYFQSDGMEIGPFQRMSAQQIAFTERALQLWAEVANITFTRGGSVVDENNGEIYADLGEANFFLQNYDLNFRGGFGNHKFFDYGGDNIVRYSQTWMNGAIPQWITPNLSNPSPTVLLHEIAHGLGFFHPGPYNTSDVTYDNAAVYFEDSLQYTVMSYFRENNTGAGFGGLFPMTPMLHDIFVMQLLYGANMTTRSDDTVYGFKSNTGSEIYGLTKSTDKRVYSIWDGGGVDTLDFSLYASKNNINLGQGEFSSVGGLKNNISIAFGAEIENAIGGTNNDKITGNELDNELWGMNGNDTLEGLGGNDKLYGGAGIDKLFGGDGDDELHGEDGNDFLVGGAGADKFFGGAGIDTADYSAEADPVTVFLGGTSEGGSAEGDTYDSIENVIGGSGDDFLTGDGGNNKLEGGAGHDTLDGGDGNDILIGGEGSDTASYLSASSAVTVTLASTGVQKTVGAGNDQFFSIENLAGSDFDDNLSGNKFDNVIDGGLGNDLIVASLGNDTLIGGGGNDTVSYANFGVPVTVSLAGGTAAYVNGKIGAEQDTLIQISNVIGGGKDDVIIGDDNGNVIEGGKGNDILDGGDGNDTASYASATAAVTVDLNLQGIAQNTKGAGIDTLSNFENILGGKGADTLIGDDNDNVLTGGAGNDTLTGNGGNDELIGGDGNDILIGGAGDDIMTGGAGNDRFDYDGQGADIITDFHAGAAKTDFIRIANTYQTFAALMGNAADVGADTVFDFGGGNKLTVENVLIADFHENDFIFNKAPVIVSNGGGDEAAISVAENSFNVTTVKATDPDKDKLTYSIEGGADAAFFAIDSVKGTLTFIAGPDFEQPLDAGNDNTYEVIVGASDGGYEDTQKIVVTVTNLTKETITGTAGNDFFLATTDQEAFKGLGGTDTVSYENATEGVTVTLGKVSNIAGYAKGDSFNSIENLNGSAFNDVLTGDKFDNWLYGGDGDDVLQGGLGNDTLSGSTGNDTASFADLKSGITLTLFWSDGIAEYMNGKIAEQDTLLSIENVIGGAGNDFIVGDVFNNVIEGGAGNDTLDGGDGNDTASYASATAAVTIDLNLQGIAQNTKGAGIDTLSNFENILGGKGADTLIGDDNDNVLTGGAGNDTLTGNGGNDVLIGGDGNDILAGGAGDDVMTGGAGNDRFDYDGQGVDTITDFEGAGPAKGDIIRIANTFSAFDELFDDINGDKLTYGGGNAEIDFGGGNKLVIENVADGLLTAHDFIFNKAPVIVSNDGGDDAAISLAENSFIVTTVKATDPDKDRLTYSIEGGADAAFFQIDGFSGALRFKAGPDFEQPQDAGNDNTYEVIVGASDGGYLGTQTIVVKVTNLTKEKITGTEGDDFFLATLDQEAIDGRGGIDTVSYANADAGVTVTLGKTTKDQGFAKGDNLKGIEILIGSAFDDVLTGDKFDNELYGGDGDDILQGGLGNDVLHGGAGNNTASFADLKSGITLTLAFGAGTAEYMNGKVAEQDTLIKIHNVIGTAKDDTITGDGNDNVIEGGKGNDTLDGGGGNNTASYASSTGAVTVDLNIQDGVTAQNTRGAGIDTLSNFRNVLGGKGADVLTGDGNANVLDGGAGNDKLDGGAGDDRLIGGLGNDLLTGGDGADEFVYTEGGGLDTIADFEDGVDRIDLSQMPGIETFDDVEALISQSGANTVITFDAKNKITLLNFNAADLGPEDFKFGNEAPVITSAAGSAAISIEFDENETAITTITAVDPDSGPDPIVFSIAGGADAAFFEIDANSGALAFKAAPDAENPQDAGADNTYEVIVEASDGAASDTQTITVNVQDVNDNAPETDDVLAEGAEDDASIAVVLTASDADVTGGINRFQLTSLPANGTLYADAGLTTPAQTGFPYAPVANSLTLYFVPDADWSGSTDFQYTAFDTDGVQDPTPATATIDVAPAADAASIAFDFTPQKSGGEFLVNTATTNTQGLNSVAALAGGGFVVTWTDEGGSGGDGSSSAVKAQIFDADGAKVGDEFLVNSFTADMQTEPTITALSGGGFVVAWRNSFSNAGAGGDGDGWSIKAQIFDTDGEKVGDEFLVNSFATGLQLDPKIAMLKNGGFAIVWQNQNSDSGTGGDGDGRSIKAQVFDPDGEKVGGEFLVNTNTTGSQFQHDIVALADGGFVVTWATNNSDIATGGDGSGWSIRAQIFDDEGEKAGDEFPVNSATFITQYQPTITALVSGGFVIVWANANSDGVTGGDGSGDSIKAQIFDADGEKVGAEFLVNTTTTNSQYQPNVVALASGGFVVSWRDESLEGTDTTGAGVKAQIFDGNGNKVDDEFLVNTTTTGDQVWPKLAELVDGRVVATWVDTSGLGGDTDISVKAQIFGIPSSGTEDHDITLPLISAAPASDTDGSESVTAIRLSGFPEGATFSLGALDGGTGEWVIDDGAEIASLAVTALVMTPPAGVHGTFSITVTAVVTDEAVLSTGAASNEAGTSQQFDIVIAPKNDLLIGDENANVLDGGAGNDVLIGNGGDDRLIGGLGNDLLTGGDGNDTFVFGETGFGKDTITDFVAGEGTDDVIEFSSAIFADYAAVEAAMTQSGAHVVITSGANSVTIQNVTIAQLHQDDFAFV